MKVCSMIRNVAFFAALSLGLAATNAPAAFTGTMGLVDFNTSINTSSLATATTFNLGGLQDNGNKTGGFLPVPTTTSFGTGSFSLGSTSALTFSNPTFGTFQETAAPLITATSVVGGVTIGETFYILGTFNPGATLGGGGPIPASFTVSFTQTGGPGTAVSASGTVSIPPSLSVPEPASIAMLGLGLVGVGAFARGRRSAK